MKVFVAVRVGEGDPFEGAEGELVRPALACKKPGCACHRSFTGMASGRSCRFARVANLSHIGRAPFRSIFFDSLTRDDGIAVTNDRHRWAMEWAERVLVAAGLLEEGTIVEYDGQDIRAVAER